MQLQVAELRDLATRSKCGRAARGADLVNQMKLSADDDIEEYLTTFKPEAGTAVYRKGRASLLWTRSKRWIMQQ